MNCFFLTKKKIKNNNNKRRNGNLVFSNIPSTQIFLVEVFVWFFQREAVEALIQELPKFRLKAVPTDCSECPICLEEFHVGNEVNFF